MMGYKPKHMAYSPKNETAYRVGLALSLTTALLWSSPALAAEAASGQNATEQSTAAETVQSEETATQQAQTTATTDAASDASSPSTSDTSTDKAAQTGAQSSEGDASAAATNSDGPSDATASDMSASASSVSDSSASGATDSSADAQKDTSAQDSSAATTDDGKDAAASEEVSAPDAEITTDVEGKGEQKTQTGQIAGTTGEARKLESVTIHIVAPDGTTYSDSDIEYRVHVSDLGWLDWVTGGSTAGEAGSGRQIEAIQFKLKDGTDLSKNWTLWARGHVQGQGWLAWTCDSPIGSTGQALRLEAFELKFLRNLSSAASENGANGIKKAPSNAANASDDPSSDDFASAKSYPFIDGTTAEIRAHVQDLGWLGWVGEGETAGTTGKRKRVEAVEAKIANAYLDGGLEYEAHVQDIGWQDWTGDGALAGTTGEAKRVEAVRFRLTGDLADVYDIWYRAHVQDIGWLAWTEDGLEAGTTGLCGRIEAIQLKIVKKGDAAPSSGDCATSISYLDSPFIEYESYVQDAGWQDGVVDGATSGTTGQAKRLEAVMIQLGSGLAGIDGSIAYQAHVQDAGWQNWVSDGAVAGTVGEGKRLEAIKIQLTGDLAKYFDVIYQAHVGDLGWTGWLDDGAIAGTVGKAHAIEALQIKLRFKGNYEDTNHWVVSGTDLYHKNASGGYDTGWKKVDGRYHLFGSDGKNYTGTVTRYGFSGNLTLAGWDNLGCFIVGAAKATPFAGVGYCSEWVIDVFQNAGYGDYHHNDACDLYYKYCNVGNCSADRSLLKPGMIVAVPRVHDNGWGEIYGHIGIYIGDGLIMHNYRRVETWTVDDWFNKFSHYQPIYCGWMGNIDLG